GLIPLWLAVLEDAFTSLLVTGNSLLLFRVTGDRATAPRPRQEEREEARGGGGHGVLAASREENRVQDGCNDACCAGDLAVAGERVADEA
ncbi:hypothetical protein OFB80_30110, partial [Escherichia coli]|nr:hypothetical protein [Escherichia coli]